MRQIILTYAIPRGRLDRPWGTAMDSLGKAENRAKRFDIKIFL